MDNDDDDRQMDRLITLPLAHVCGVNITRVNRDGSAKKCRNKGARNHDLTDKVHT